MHYLAQIILNRVADNNRDLETLKAYLSNDTAPLEERWNTFLAVADTMSTEKYGDGFVEDLDPNATLYDDFYVERHETVSYKDMYERIQERLDGAEEEYKYSQEKVDAWREKVLASGYGSFTYDW